MSESADSPAETTLREVAERRLIALAAYLTKPDGPLRRGPQDVADGEAILAILDELSAAKSVIDELVTLAKSRDWSPHAPLTAWITEAIDERDALRSRCSSSELALREAQQPEAGDGWMDVVIALPPLLRACQEGYGELATYLGAHDFAKRLYRMGYRKTAPPELSACRYCGAVNVVTAQSRCIECVGRVSPPKGDTTNG